VPFPRSSIFPPILGFLVAVIAMSSGRGLLHAQSTPLLPTVNITCLTAGLP